MDDGFVAVKAIISCLKDLEMTDAEINDRITKWVQAKGFDGDWQDLSNDCKLQLGKAIQKYFESEFLSRRRAA